LKGEDFGEGFFREDEDDFGVGGDGFGQDEFYTAMKGISILARALDNFFGVCYKNIAFGGSGLRK
jgi:hypothetical protein